MATETVNLQNFDIFDPNIVDTSPFKHRRTTIFVELTDKNITDVDIQRTMHAGANVLKFKSGLMTRQEKSWFLEKVEKAMARCRDKNIVKDFPVATCVTLKTCMMKTGLLENEEDSIYIPEGIEIVLTNHPQYIYKCNTRTIFVDNPQLAIEMKEGMEVNISQAEIVLEVISVHETGRSVKCKCVKAGKLKNMVSVSVRNLMHTRPYMTSKDLEILKFAVDYQIDIVVINYVRSSETIRKAKRYLTRHTGDKTKRPIILAGICTEVGLNNIDSLLKESDGLIIARDYLPYELPKEMQYRLPMIQKYLAGKCLKAGKPFFISGGVFINTLEYGILMYNEVMDVSNALLEGATGFIIKDCVDIDNVLAVIEEINRLCCYVEPMIGGKTGFWEMVDEIKMPLNAAEAAVLSATAAANQTQSRVLILPTVSGRTVRAILRMRPNCIVIAVSTNLRITRLLLALRGVVPLYYTDLKKYNKYYKLIEARVDYAVEYAVSKYWLKRGDMYVSLHRSTDTSCYCDMVRIWAVAFTKKTSLICPYEYDFEVGSANIEDGADDEVEADEAGNGKHLQSISFISTWSKAH